VAVGDWVPQTRYALPTTLSLDGALTEFSINMLLLSTGDDLGLVAEVGVVETQREVLAKRVIGGVVFRANVSEDSTVYVHERIRVGMLNADGDPSFFATNMNDADDANEPFLWERVSTIALTEGFTSTWPQADVGHPGWSQIDCRVARKLTRADALYYSVSVTRFEAGFFSVGDVFIVTSALRTWARALV